MNFQIARNTRKLQAAELLALVGDGYTLRRGTRQTGRVRFEWEWQLFTPGGEFTGAVDRHAIEKLADGGAGDLLHWAHNDPLKGAHR